MNASDLPPEATALVDAAIGRWSTGAPAQAAPSRPVDPLRAIAARCDLPATGSGPLDGRTLVVKDNVAVAGVGMAVGSGLPGFVPKRDATIVERARAAGARVGAKAQCEAFLLGANSFTSRPEPVRNPHDPTRSAGGSSSGSAALVAARLADLAIGSDSGGSIRIPAAFCGVVGFKPTRGRVSCTGVTPMEPTLAHTGPIARTVADVAELFAAIEGLDGLDPRQAWSRLETPGRRSETTPLRIGVLEPAMALAVGAIGACLGEALDQIDAAGHTRTVLAWPDREEAEDLHLTLYVIGQALVAERAAGPAGLAVTNPDGWAEWRSAIAEDDLPAGLRLEVAAGRAMLDRDPGLYVRALARGRAIADALDALLADVDLLALPTAASPPPVRPQGVIPDALLYGDTRLTAPFNVTGHPALSLPAGVVDGLPVGLQLVARRGADTALLVAAAAIERVLGPAPRPIGDFGDPL